MRDIRMKTVDWNERNLGTEEEEKKKKKKNLMLFLVLAR